MRNSGIYAVFETTRCSPAVPLSSPHGEYSDSRLREALLPASVSGLLMGLPTMTGFRPGRHSPAAADADFIAHSTGRARRIPPPRGSRNGRPVFLCAAACLSAFRLTAAVRLLCNCSKKGIKMRNTRRPRSALPGLFLPKAITGPSLRPGKRGRQVFHPDTKPDQWLTVLARGKTPHTVGIRLRRILTGLSFTVASTRRSAPSTHHRPIAYFVVMHYITSESRLQYPISANSHFWEAARKAAAILFAE